MNPTFLRRVCRQAVANPFKDFLAAIARAVSPKEIEDYRRQWLPHLKGISADERTMANDVCDERIRDLRAVDKPAADARRDQFVLLGQIKTKADFHQALMVVHDMLLDEDWAYMVAPLEGMLHQARVMATEQNATNDGCAKNG